MVFLHLFKQGDYSITHVTADAQWHWGLECCGLCDQNKTWSIKLCSRVTFAFVCASACVSTSMSPLSLSGWKCKCKCREWVSHPFSAFDASTDIMCKQLHLVPWNPFMMFHVDTNANVTCKQLFSFWIVQMKDRGDESCRFQDLFTHNICVCMN